MLKLKKGLENAKKLEKMDKPELPMVLKMFMTTNGIVLEYMLNRDTIYYDDETLEYFGMSEERYNEVVVKILSAIEAIERPFEIIKPVDVIMTVRAIMTLL